MTVLTDEMARRVNLAIGRRLRKIREKAGLSPDEMAGWFDITRKSYLRYETGEAKVTAAMLLFVSVKTGVPVGVLTGGILKKEGKDDETAEDQDRPAGGTDAAGS